MNEQEKNEYEDIIQKLLKIISEKHTIREVFGDYEDEIISLLTDKRLMDISKSNEIFDVMQAIEGVNSSVYNLSQKILKLISNIDINNKKEEIDITNDIINHNKSKINKSKIKDNKKEQNLLINNALDYLREVFDKNFTEGDENE